MTDTANIKREILNAQANGSGQQKYLLFSLLDETYGIPLNSVKEVIGLTEITQIPHVPKYFKGLINLRGMIISVIDLRVKVGLPQEDYVPMKTCVVIVEISGLTVGLIVDDVNEVANFDPEQIESKIHTASSVNESFLDGVARREGDKLTILLNVEKTLTSADLSAIKSSMNRGVAAA